MDVECTRQFVTESTDFVICSERELCPLRSSFVSAMNGVCRIFYLNNWNTSFFDGFFSRKPFEFWLQFPSELVFLNKTKKSNNFYEIRNIQKRILRNWANFPPKGWVVQWIFWSTSPEIVRKSVGFLDRDRFHAQQKLLLMLCMKWIQMA